MRTAHVVRAVALGGLLCWGATASAAKIEILNFDPPGEGFNDPTPATPVGGNTGTTLGQQRLIAYQRALDLWGSVLKSSQTIQVVGTFSYGPFEGACNAGGGVLAQAGTIQIFADFPNAPKKNVWYGSALSNSLAREDLAPLNEENDEFSAADIVAQFNGGVGRPDCVAGPGWYYGLDNDAPAGAIDFLDTFMHEVGHGLGFGNFIDERDGELPIPGIPYPDVYMTNVLDTTLNKTWDKLTPAQIVASAVNTNNVVWGGKQVTKSAPLVLGPYETLKITAPASIAREIESAAAAFGGPVNNTTFSGDVAIGTSVANPVLTDGCTAITPTVAGKIALVDRGGCIFIVKAANAQAAGAKGVIVANNAPGFITMTGDDPTVTIPAVMISQADGALLKANATGAKVGWVVDPKRRAGANSKNQVKLYAPAVVQPGSTNSHFDTSAEPSLLMEPFITSELQSATNVDLTAQLFKDLGWPIESLKIGKCDTKVPNVTPVGDIISTQIEQCAADTDNRGEFVGCAVHVGLGLKFQKFIDIQDFLRIAVCAATVRNP